MRLLLRDEFVKPKLEVIVSEKSWIEERVKTAARAWTPVLPSA